MENASKALIIAGAILLAIAIIGVGMFVFQSVQGTIQDKANFSQEEIEAYNGEFEPYIGAKKNGSQVKSLCDKVRAHNQTAVDPSKLIAIVQGQATDPTPAPSDENAKDTTAAEINKLKGTILSGKTYSVTVGYDKDSALITQIGIEEVK